MPKTTLVKCTLRWKSYISFLHYALINFNFKIPIKFTFLWKVAEMDSIYSSVGGAVEARGHTYFSEWGEFSYAIGTMYADFQLKISCGSARSIWKIS